MTEQIILIIGIAAAFIFSAVTVRRQATEARKWASFAFGGMLLYMCASYMIPFFADATSFMFLKEAAIIGGGLAASSFILSAAALGGVNPSRTIYSGFIIVSCIFIVAIGTLRIHNLGFADISFKEPGSDGLYTATFTRGTVYLGAVAGYAGLLIITALYVIIAVCRSKASGGAAKFAAVISLAPPVFMILSVFDVAIAPMIAQITAIVAGIILFGMVMIADRSDVLAFGKTSSINNVGDGLIILDGRKKFLFANKTANRLFLELSENDNGKINEFLASLPEKGEFTRADHVYMISRSDYTDYSGKCDCTVISAQDITEQKLHEDRLSEEASVDSITGLSSRSAVIKALTPVIEEAEGTLMILSFDGFKAINNAYGSEDANKVLKTFGTLLKNNTQTDDVRGRFGGENFIIFLRGCLNSGVLANITMRLEEQVQGAVKRTLGELPFSVGISVGAVLVPNCGRDFDKLTELAEAELEKITKSGGHGYSLNEGGAAANTESLPDMTVETLPDSEDKPADDKPAEEKATTMEDLLM